MSMTIPGKTPSFWVGFEKQSSHVAELLGLGALALPSASALAGKPWSPKKEHAAEVAGLGILAAPSAYALGKKLLRKKVGV